MGAVTLSRTYNARLTALLDKIRPVIESNITTSNAFFYKYKKSGNWKVVTELGDRLRVPLMYEFAPVDTFGANNVGVVDITPTDGQTPAFFDWARLASSITIGDFERAQNKGAAIDLLKTKTEQAMSGLEDRFGRWLLQGQGVIDTTSISTARTSPINNSTFIEPIPLMIHKTPSSTSIAIGQINQVNEPWWRNQAINMNVASYNATFAALLKGIDHLVNLCSMQAGSGPDIFIADMLGYEVICAALRVMLRFVDYEEVGFPFKSFRLNGAPFTFDQFVPDATSPSTTVQAGAYSTVYAANTKYMGVSVYSGANFTPGEFVRAPNGAGESALIQWYGAHWCSRRDKQGVAYAIKNDLTS